MADYLLLMHDDATVDEVNWDPYLAELQRRGVLQGGSAIGDGACIRKSGNPGPITARLVGYIRVTADSLDQARSFVYGNPVYEAGGTVEIRELPRTE